MTKIITLPIPSWGNPEKSFYKSLYQIILDKLLEDKLLEFQLLFDNMSKLKTNSIILNNNFITSVNKQDIHNCIQHYLEGSKDFDTKSFPDASTKKCIVDRLGNPICDINNICIDVSEINDWILNELNKNPTDLYKLSSYRFEELIAEILIRKGYKVELTPATRDGGKDIYAVSQNDLGSFLYIVECKKYKPTHKVGVNVLRDLYGVLSKERATYGVVVTTSYFSKPAQEFQQDVTFQMSLQDFSSIKKWLCDVT